MPASWPKVLSNGLSEKGKAGSYSFPFSIFKHIRHTCLIGVDPMIVLSDVLGSLIHCLFLPADSPLLG